MLLLVLYLSAYFQLVPSQLEFVEDEDLNNLPGFLRQVSSMDNSQTIALVHGGIEKKLLNEFYKLEKPVYNINLDNVGVFNIRSGKRLVSYEESKLYFMVIERLEDYPRTLLLLRQIKFWRDREKVIVITMERASNDNIEDILKNNFILSFKYFILNLIFTYRLANTTTFNVLSYNPFSGNYGLEVNGPEMFPDKLRDLHGYTLRISMYDDVMNTIPNGYDYKGRDGIMVKAMVKHLNASYVYLRIKADEVAEPLINVQFAQVSERRADVGFNTRYVKLMFARLVEGTYPHDRDDLICLVPKRGINHVTNLAETLPPIVWIETAIAAVVFSIILISCAKYNHDKITWYDAVETTLLALLAKGVRELKTYRYRMVLSFFIFLCFFVNMLLQCKLSSLLTAPDRFPEMDTINELAIDKVPILTLPRFKEMINATLRKSARDRMVPRTSVIDEDFQLDEITKCRKIVHICKRHIAEYATVRQQNFPNDIQFYRIMKEPIMPSITCYIVWFGSPFKKTVSEAVQRILEGGIQDYWKGITWHQLSLAGRVVFGEDQSVFTVLSLESMIVTFNVLIAGLALSCVLFIGEIWYHHCTQKIKKRRRRILGIADKTK